jgi:hypothetical protein
MSVPSSTGGAIQSDQLHSVLRYGGDVSFNDNNAPIGESAGDSLEAPWQQQFMFEESTTLPPAAAYRQSNAYTPMSSVRFDFVNDSRAGVPTNVSGSDVLAAGRIQPPLPGTDNNNDAPKKSNKVRNALVIAAVILLVLIGIAIVVWLVKQHSSPSSSSVLSEALGEADSGQSAIQSGQLFDDHQEQEEQQQQQIFENPLNDFYAEEEPAAFGIAIPEIQEMKDSSSGRPSVSGMTVATERNVADDHKRYQPPAPSWFGAKAAPRREDQKRDIDTAVLNAEGDIGKIYDKNRGGGNSVLGGANCAPYATVNADAARFVGWAEQTPYDPAQDPSLDPNNGNRSMMSLYQDKMKRTEIDTGVADRDGNAPTKTAMYRDGSSLSTVRSATSAAEQAARVGDPQFESKEAQFEQGRARAKQIASEASAAITGIYERKHRAAAGNIVSEAAAQNDDPNFAYFNMSTQSMLGNE